MTTNFHSIHGQRVHMLRKNLCLTQGQLADISGTDARHVRRIEKQYVPSLETLKNIADITETRLDFLLGLNRSMWWEKPNRNFTLEPTILTWNDSMFKAAVNQSKYKSVSRFMIAFEVAKWNFDRYRYGIRVPGTHTLVKMMRMLKLSADDFYLRSPVSQFVERKQLWRLVGGFENLA